MTSAADTRRMTAEELYMLPDDGMKHELVCGRLLSEPPAGWDHGKRISRIDSILVAFVRERGLGSVAVNDTGFILARGPDTVRGPDIAFVSRERERSVHNPQAFFPGAPDLAVEVLSPGDRPGEVHGKVADYLEAGVRLVWIVDSVASEVVVHRSLFSPVTLKGEDVLDGGDVLPGFSVRVREIFED